MERNKLIEQLQQLQEKKLKKWIEAFEDEDTHEMVDVERSELLTTETSTEEYALWQQIVPLLPKLSDEELLYLKWDVLNSTDIDDTPIVEVQAQRGDVYALSQIGDIAKLQELCEQGNHDAARELYFKYIWGDEENGIFINRKKAKEYYDLAGDAVYDEWDDSDDPGEEDPSTYEYTLTGNADTLNGIRKMIDDLCRDYGTPGNELGLYVPQRLLMKLLVGSDTEYYRGNVLTMEQPALDRLVITTEADSGYPLLYALRQCFDNLEITMEESDI
jgi:hypothetical protein